MAPGSRRRSGGRDVILFDSAGRPFNATALTESNWKGSAENRRTRAWVASSSSINAMLAGDVVELRRRSRDVVRKSPWAESATESFVANAVGNGIVPRPLTDDDDLRRELMEAWDEFVGECDADGTSDFYGLQALVCRAYKEGGDCFVRLRQRRSSDGFAVPLQLQVLEAELCDPGYEQLLTNGRVQAGVEFDGIGKRTAYHMWRQHPGEIVSTRNTERVRVPAENVLHVFQVLRPGQIRGVPGLASALAKLHGLETYDDAELERKQIAAMFAGFVTNPGVAGNPLDAGNPEKEGVDDDETPLARLEPGTMQELDPGQSIVFSEPAESGSSYEPFQHNQLRQVAAAGDVMYEQMTGDLTGVNFSSIRAGLIEFWRRMAQHQRNVLIFQLCRPVWRRFVEQSVLSGRIAIPSDPRQMRALTRVAWTPTPGREYVDPEKEVRAVVAKIRAGLISRSRAVAENGFDAEALDREIAADNLRADGYGLRFDGDGRIPAGAAAAAAAGGAPAPRLAPARDGEEEEEQAEAVFRALRYLAARQRLAA